MRVFLWKICIGLAIGFQAENLKNILNKLSKLSAGNKHADVARVSRQVIKSIISESLSSSENHPAKSKHKELLKNDFSESLVQGSNPVKLTSLFLPVRLKNGGNNDEMDEMLLNMVAYSLNVEGIKDVSAKDLFNYGCWCSLDARSNKGPTLDSIDEKCRFRSQCRKCATIDNNCLGQSLYTVYVDTQFAKPKLTCSHSENEANNCKKTSCECDLEFVNNVIEQIKTDQFYPYYSRTALDHKHVCLGFPEGSSHQGMEKSTVENDDNRLAECCGEHPKRFPFSSKGNRACCLNRTYDQNLYDCCRDGSVQSIGDC